jgi:hypothetical protein
MHDPVNSPALDKSGKHSRSVIQRFWKNVYRRQDHQCWNWIGSKMVRGGYGQLSNEGTLLKAHRLSWEINLGTIPEGMMIRHLCHNPSCCNPTHLLPGTAKDNHLDMQKAGRMFVPKTEKGENNANSKLTKTDVMDIYTSQDRGANLARKYKVSKTLISRIRHGIAWLSVTNHKEVTCND